MFIGLYTYSFHICIMQWYRSPVLNESLILVFFFQPFITVCFWEVLNSWFKNALWIDGKNGFLTSSQKHSQSSRGCIKVSLLGKRSWLMTWLIKSSWHQENCILICKMQLDWVNGFNGVWKLGQWSWLCNPPPLLHKLLKIY